MPNHKYQAESARNKNCRLKNCETFVGAINTDMHISSTLRKIMENGKTPHSRRNNSASLKSYLSERNFVVNVLSDDEIKNKITLNCNKLKFDKEIKELYGKKPELKTIESEPVYPDYLGHRFRK